MPTPSLLQCLKERKLFQWAIAYLAGAWVLVEATGHVVAQFQWAPIIGQVVTVLAFFGFFVVLVIAWYHGEKGRQWVSGPELLIIALLLLISGGVLSMLGRGGESLERPEASASVALEDGRPRVAVLPCANMSAEPGDGYLAPALHLEILLKLQGISSLFSIGRTSVLQYEEDPPATDQIATALGVGFVGECSVQKYGNQIRLIFQLLDGRTGGQIWADDYDQELTAANLLDIQSDIAQRVAQAVGAALTPDDEARMARVPTENLTAYEYYLLGRNVAERRYAEGWDVAERGIEFFQRAIQADSSFALAYASMASVYVASHYWGPGGRNELENAYRLARDAAAKALSLDSLSAEAHMAWGAVLLHADHDLEGAENEFRRALELDPGCYDAVDWMDELLRVAGRYEEAVEFSYMALELEPKSASSRSTLASSLWGVGRLEEAARELEAVAAAGTPLEYAARLNSDLPEGWIGATPVWFHEIYVYEDMGLSYRDAFGRLLANLAAGGARPAELRAYQERWGGLDWAGLWEFVRDPSKPGSLAGNRAAANARLGQREEAVAELRRGWEEGEAGMFWIHGNPFFRNLEGYGPYEELLEELGLGTRG